MARDAIAEGYLSQCAALWIISPITRAVDDKEARALLDHSFKRQLALDGSLSNLTFVCSKTDDYDVRETVETISAASPVVKKIFVRMAEIDANIKADEEKLDEMRQVQMPELMDKLKAVENRLRELSMSELDDKTNGVQPKRGAEEALSDEAAQDPAAKRAKTGSIDANGETATVLCFPLHVGEEEANTKMADDTETRDICAAKLRE